MQAKLKRFFTICVFVVATQFAWSQACGMYRIEYVGTLEASHEKSVTVHLPTTLLLHGSVGEMSEDAFTAVDLSNGVFNGEISSHLTTPFTEIDPLISFYKQQSDSFVMKIAYSESGVPKERTIELAWDKIEVSIVEDGNFGTLFRFTLNGVSL